MSGRYHSSKRISLEMTGRGRPNVGADPALQRAAICRDSRDVMSPLVVRPTGLWTLPAALLYDNQAKGEAMQEIGTA
jgi:hypothetical protein